MLNAKKKKNKQNDGLDEDGRKVEMLSVEPNLKAKLPILIPVKLEGKVGEGCIISNTVKDKKNRRL